MIGCWLVVCRFCFFFFKQKTAYELRISAWSSDVCSSDLATNMAFSAALRLIRDREAGVEEGQSSGAGVAFFSLEMSADQLATRILAEQSGISSENLRMGKISRSEEHTSELQSLMRISYAVFCLKKKKKNT